MLIISYIESNILINFNIYIYSLPKYEKLIYNCDIIKLRYLELGDDVEMCLCIPLKIVEINGKRPWVS